MAGIGSRSEYCGCPGRCFAKGSSGKCRLLTEAYLTGCPFQKPDRQYTKGKFYPDHPYEDPSVKVVGK